MSALRNDLIFVSFVTWIKVKGCVKPLNERRFAVRLVVRRESGLSVGFY